MRAGGFAAGSVLIFAVGASASDPRPPLEIRAERIVYHTLERRFEASGGVELRRGDSTLQAETLSFDERSRRGTASGDVVIVDGPDTLRSSHVDLDMERMEGVILDGEVRSPGFRVEGGRIEKTGRVDYRLEGGRFTSCECEGEGRDPWAIRVDEAELSVGGYGTARGARFEVLGVPVLWVPWLLYPVKVERQSGVLLPELTLSGRNGVEVGLPVFLALGDPVGLTLTPRWLSDRGAQGDLELEWVLGRESEGEIFGSFLYDDAVQPHTPSEPFDRERWVAAGRQDWHLPLGARFQTDFHFVSDNQYPTDFERPASVRSQRFLESTAVLSRGFGRSGAFGLVAAAQHADDLQSPDDLDRDELLLQRLPQLEAALLPAPLPWLSRLVPALGGRFTWYHAEGSLRRRRLPAAVVGPSLFLDTGIDSLPDAQEPGPLGTGMGADPSGDNAGSPFGTEGDGFFQEGEPLADRGQRLLLTPRLGLPLRLFDLLEFYPEVGWHQKLYRSDAQSLEQAGFVIGRADLRARLRRSFGAGWVHVLEPRAGWAFASDAGQASKPLFVPPTAVPQRRLRQLHLDSLVLDPADRVENLNSVTLALGNRLYGSGRLLAELLLSGGFEATDAEFDPVYLDARAYPWKQSDTWVVLGFDPERARVDEALLSLLWRFEAGHRLGLGYRYLRRVGRFFEDYRYASQRFGDFDREFDRVHEISGRGRLMLAERWALTYQGGFSFERSLVLANRGGIEYFSGCGCWSAGIELAQDRVRGVSVSFVYSLTGFGRDQVARAAKRRSREGIGFLDGL